jgi:hypothetical protein
VNNDWCLNIKWSSELVMMSSLIDFFSLRNEVVYSLANFMRASIQKVNSLFNSEVVTSCYTWLCTFTLSYNEW